MTEWSSCACCYPQKPKVRKAIGWFVWAGEQEVVPVPEVWYVEIGGYPRGSYTTWERAMEAAALYLTREVMP